MGVATFTSLMRELHAASTARPMTTETLESFLLARSGAADLVDAFHRFVYGLPRPRSPEIGSETRSGTPAQTRGEAALGLS